MMTAYISPVLAKAGVFHQAGLFGLPDQASFVAATFLGLFIGTIAVSQIADRFGRKRVFVGSLLWYTAAAVVMATADHRDRHRRLAADRRHRHRRRAGHHRHLHRRAGRRARCAAAPSRSTSRSSSWPCRSVAFAAWKLGPLTIAGIEGWRWVVLLGAAAAIGVWFIQVRLPESPRWLAEHGRLAEPTRC